MFTSLCLSHTLPLIADKLSRRQASCALNVRSVRLMRVVTRIFDLWV